MLWSFDKPSRGMSKQESNLEADTEFASDENFADYILEGVRHRAVSLQSQIPRVYWTQCQINPFWVQNRSKNSRKPFLTKDANSKAPNTYQKNIFPSMFLNRRHLFLASGRLYHYFQTSHLSPASTRQLALMNSPAQPLLVSGLE